MPEVPRIDEFAFILLGGVLMIFLLMVLWSTPSEAPPVFEPKSVELTIRQGSSKSFDIQFEGTFSGINLTALGDIKGWVMFSKQNFDVHEKGTVKVTVKVPENKPAGNYNGRIEVHSAGGIAYVTVAVEVLEQTERVAKKQTFLGDFTVSYSKGSEILDSKKGTVTKSYFDESSLILTGSITGERLQIITDAYIQLEIEQTNNAGNLIVLVNGEQIFESSASGTITIPVDKELLKTSNIVEIKAGTPGWKFWTSTVYKLSVSFGINYESTAPKTFSFDLTAEQVENFKSLDLSYRVSDYKLPLPELMIKINNQLVLWERPPLLLADYSFTKDLFGNDIQLSETNTISFSFDREAYYSIADAILTVNYYS